MKALILVAGYATRLHPLTLNKPKALLPIGGKPIIDYIIEQINTIDEIDEIFVVSNHKFADNFNQWAQNKNLNKKPIYVIDDGTMTEETRKGAIGDILYTINGKNIDDEVMIIAGDNFFTYSLNDYFNYYKKLNKDCICVKEYNNPELLKQMGVAELDKNNKVVSVVEKPKIPKSNTAIYATYIYTKDTVKLFKKYIDDGNNPDSPGYFVEWLYKTKDVFAYVIDGECYDIGTPEVYYSVCEKFAQN